MASRLQGFKESFEDVALIAAVGFLCVFFSTDDFLFERSHASGGSGLFQELCGFWHRVGRFLLVIQEVFVDHETSLVSFFLAVLKQEESGKMITSFSGIL